MSYKHIRRHIGFGGHCKQSLRTFNKQYVLDVYLNNHNLAILEFRATIPLPIRYEIISSERLHKHIKVLDDQFSDKNFDYFCKILHTKTYASVQQDQEFLLILR